MCLIWGPFHKRQHWHIFFPVLFTKFHAFYGDLEWLGRGKSGDLCLDRYPCDPDPEEWKKMVGWMDSSLKSIYNEVHQNNWWLRALVGVTYFHISAIGQVCPPATLHRLSWCNWSWGSVSFSLDKPCSRFLTFLSYLDKTRLETFKPTRSFFNTIGLWYKCQIDPSFWAQVQVSSIDFASITEKACSI